MRLPTAANSSDDAFMLNRQTGNATSRIQPIRCRKCICWADIKTLTTASTMIGLGNVIGQVGIGENNAQNNQDPACLETRFVCLPCHPRPACWASGFSINGAVSTNTFTALPVLLKIGWQAVSTPLTHCDNRAREQTDILPAVRAADFPLGCDPAIIHSESNCAFSVWPHVLRLHAFGCRGSEQSISPSNASSRKAERPFLLLAPMAGPTPTSESPVQLPRHSASRVGPVLH